MTKCGQTGKLRKLIDILEQSSVRKSGGGRDATWTVSTTVWAEIVPKKSNPLIEASNKENQITHNITARIVPGLNTKNRIRFGTRFFFIQNVLNKDELDRFNLIEARENTKAVVVVT